MSTAMSRIDSQGQVTIPEDMRRELGLKAGDTVECSLEGTRTGTLRAPRRV